jgi:hypothetical protein
MILARKKVHRETNRERLNIHRRRDFGCMRLPGLGSRFGADYVFRSGKGEQVALFRRVEKICGADSPRDTRIAAPG